MRYLLTLTHLAHCIWHMTIRAWLFGFVLLFAAVELLEWMFELGSAQPGGYWAMLGGLGLAAASNAKHLPKIGDKSASANTDKHAVDASGAAANKPKTTKPFQTEQIKTEQIKTEQNPTQKTSSTTDKAVDRSEDSISFRVRLPWR